MGLARFAVALLQYGHLAGFLKVFLWLSPFVLSAGARYCVSSPIIIALACSVELGLFLLSHLSLIVYELGKTDALGV
jgi:hypothetical protein